MVNRCIICKKYWDKGCGRSFHKFPKNSEVRKIWIDALDLKDAELKRATVCSDHFLSEDLLTNLSGARLKLNAVPNIIPVSSDIHHNESNKDIEPDNDNSVEDLPQISFFPRNPMLKKQWFLLLGIDKNKILPASAVICMHHFTKNDFDTKPSGMRVLKAGALPLPFHPVNLSSHNASSDSSVTHECIETSKESNQFDSPPRKREYFPESRKESCDLMWQTSSSATLTVSGGSSLGVDRLAPTSVTLTASETEELMRSVKGNKNMKQTHSQSAVEPGPSKKSLVSMPKKRFPSDGNLRKDWLHTLGYQENKCLPKRADICSRHFDSNDFEIKPGGRKYLKRGAVPKPLLPSTQSSQEHSLNLSSVSSTNPIHSELVENLYNLSSSIEIHIKNSESDDENALTTRCAEEEVIGGTVTNRISPKIELDTSSECEEEVNNVPTIEAVEETIEYLSDSSTLTAISEKSLGSDDPSNSEKITSNVSKTHLEFEKEYPVKEKRTTKLSRYFEDYSVEYMNSRAKKNWQTARKTISEQKTRIQRIQRQNGRMKSRVEKLQSLLKHLFHNYEFKKKG